MNTAEAVAKFVEESPEFMMIDTDDTGDGWTIISEEELEELLTRASAAGMEPDDMGKETPDYSVGCWEASWIWISNKEIIWKGQEGMEHQTLFEEKRIIEDAPNADGYHPTFTEAKVRLVSCKIDGHIRLHRRLTVNHVVRGWEPDYTPISDGETLLPLHTNKNEAIRETIVLFDETVKRIEQEKAQDVDYDGEPFEEIVDASAAALLRGGTGLIS